MTDSFLRSMRAIGSFSEPETRALFNRLSLRTYEKGALLLDKGETCSCFWLIEEGSVHSFYHNSELDEVTTGLFIPGDWVVEQTSFTTRKHSNLKLQAFERTITQVLTIHDLHHLIAESQVFFQLGKVLGNYDQESYRKDQTPDDRYLQLLEKEPGLLQIFPLKYIASYLGVTPETLSRIRKRISHIS